MLPCEYGECETQAEYLIVWNNRMRPVSLTFKEENFVCGKHLRIVRKITRHDGDKLPLEVYKLEPEGKEKVQFT